MTSALQPGTRRFARRTVLGALLIALVLPAAALADTVGAVGINDLRSDGILLPNASWNGTADLNLTASAGVQLYRARIQLNCVDPAHTGRFDFTTPSPSCYGLSYDGLVRALAQRNVTLLPVLMNFNGGTPQPPTQTGAGGSPTISEFAAFAAAAAARYKPGGTFWSGCGCAPHPVEAWEIWNEENDGWWWGGNSSAGDYAAVFSATRTALRSADPQARAVVGGLAFDPAGQPSFVTPADMIRALTATNANAFDAVAVHPYTEAAGASSSQLADAAVSLIAGVAQDVAADTGPGPGGAPRQQIWVTEMGWSNQSASVDTIAGGVQDFFGELETGTRAQYNVGPVLWYDLRDNSTVQERDDQIGLRYTAPDGSDAGPKPEWGAFTAAAQREPALDLPPALSDAAPYVAPASAAPPAAPPAPATVAGPPPSALSAVLTPAPAATVSGVQAASQRARVTRNRARIVCRTVRARGHRRSVVCASRPRRVARVSRSHRVGRSAASAHRRGQARRRA